MLKWLLLPFFVGKLLILLTRFILKLIFFLYPTEVLASLSFILALILTVIFLEFSNITKPAVPQWDTTKLRAETEKWENLALLYPTHRDILLNAAIAEKQLNQEDKAREYWQKAWRQDPNFPVLITHPLANLFTPKNNTSSNFSN